MRRISWPVVHAETIVIGCAGHTFNGREERLATFPPCCIQTHKTALRSKRRKPTVLTLRRVYADVEGGSAGGNNPL